MMYEKDKVKIHSRELEIIPDPWIGMLPMKDFEIMPDQWIGMHPNQFVNLIGC